MDTQPTESHLTATQATELVQSCLPNNDDPPPPYPSRERRPRTTGRRRHAQRIQTALSQDPGQGPFPPGPQSDDVDETHHHTFPSGTAPTETTALLAPSSPFLGHASLSTGRRRRQSISHTSVASAAPSLGQTVLSLFNTTDDELEDEDACTMDDQDHGRTLDAEDLQSNRQRLLDTSRDVTTHGYGCEWTSPDRSESVPLPERTQKGGFFSRSAWRRYFRPLCRAPYYKALFHLLVLNFPYALAAWVYLFVFTLTGTTLLMALPLGAVLCFVDLLGARTFARGELALQSRYHSPLAYPPPYPPRPIFARFRSPTASELEMGITVVPEPSFYKNAYAMFTDATSYQALFYFLVIKPSITILLSLFLLIFTVPAMVLILPAPAALRAVRRLGAWQANVAIEGLYIAVR